ncbi:hypothetical protein PHET_10234 [Paragonimus heterotremus]|uniref:Uncharacterized protein n=1 Tax=Paragonimus heterotremus TaxID=100268 RepID=A0A8J4SIV6_9TREM|nr:hypothetical protein PHET_10234 [Paragonimus heterotremus]
MELKQLVSTSAATLDQLCFERQQLRVECDQLEQTMRTMDSERTQRLTEKENAIRQQNDRFAVLRTKCSMYEELTDTRFMTNDGSTVACMLGYCLPRCIHSIFYTFCSLF